MQERPDSRIQSTGHPFTRNGLKTATASDVGFALAHAAIKMPATEWTDSVYGASLVHVQELARLIGLPLRDKSRYARQFFPHTHNRARTCEQILHRELNQIVIAEMSGDDFNIGWDQICR
jgi:hypothetical protein